LENAKTAAMWWMIQRREQVRSTTEAREALGIPRDLGRQQLDGDLTPEPGVTRPVHLVHSARTQRADDLVDPEHGPRVHRRSRLSDLRQGGFAS